MYRYEYETISCNFGGWGFVSGNVYNIENYRSVIEKRAGTGHTQEIDLIFEKEE